MENIHDWINTGALAILTILFLYQKSILNYMKTAMQAVDVDKIKKAQEFINESRDHEVKVRVSRKIKEITQKVGKEFTQREKSFYEAHDELLNHIFNFMKDDDWETREIMLKAIPKNADTIRTVLKAYDKGELSGPDKKDH